MKNIENEIKSIEKKLNRKSAKLKAHKKSCEEELVRTTKELDFVQDRLARTRNEFSVVMTTYPDVVLLSDGSFQSKSVTKDFDGMKFSDVRSMNLFVSPYKNIDVNGNLIRVYSTPTRSSLIKYVWSYQSPNIESGYHFTNFFTRTKFTEDVLRASRKEIINFIDYKKIEINR